MSWQAYRSKLLCSLIERYEQSKAFLNGQPTRRRPQIRLQQSEFTDDYNDENDYRKRDQINEALMDLAELGIVEVGWARFREGEEAERVFLQYDLIDQAYELAQLKPREAKLNEVREVLAPLADHPWEWVRVWWQEIDQHLGLKRSAGLQIDSPGLFADLVKVLEQLPACSEGVLKRNFSQQVFGDSKRFEQVVERFLVRLLERFSPEEYETSEEYLDSVGIVANPELTLVAGDLTLQVDGHIVEVSNFPGGCGLTNETIRECSIAAVGARALLTVENLTSYHSVVTACASEKQDLLCIYTGGFPRRSTQRLILKLAAYLKENQVGRLVYHWGDMDYGGIRIFQFIKRNFFTGVRPLLMDRATYELYASRGLSFSDVYGGKLGMLRDDPEYVEWNPLLEAMVEKRVRVEQEAVSHNDVSFEIGKMVSRSGNITETR